jgi:hypothetical protein
MAFDLYFQFDRFVCKGLQVCESIKDFQSPENLCFIPKCFKSMEKLAFKQETTVSSLVFNCNSMKTQKSYASVKVTMTNDFAVHF